MSGYDCQRCGACCVNLPANVRDGFLDYVPVEPRDRLRHQPELMHKFVVLNDRGGLHMKLTPDGRCLALDGKLGERVRCTIYEERPSACRRVQPGTALCLRYRHEQGLDRVTPEA